MNVEPNRVGQFPFRKADPEERKRNFSEVQQPYSEEEVMREADRCLLCGTPVCIDACPVLLDVRGMNEAVSRGDFKTAHERIRETNPLLGVTGRCCPSITGLMRGCLCTEMVWPANWNWPYSEICCRLGAQEQATTAKYRSRHRKESCGNWCRPCWRSRSGFAQKIWPPCGYL